MNNLTDQQLLRDYVSQRSETAFAELARRHVDLVYSAALRMVRDTHLAEDVTQSAFLALSQNAGQLTDRRVLSGWLHRTTQNLAANLVRTEVRRRTREQEAAAMNELLTNEPVAIWENIAPHLDAALGELSEPDRDALLLRYFERKSAREMAQTLGTSEEAAQKRVNRAVERLRDLFSKRNVTVGASGLAVLISANAVQAAPIGLIAMISTAVCLAGTAVQTSTAIAATKTIAMTTLQKTLVAASIAVLAGVGIYESRQASELRGQVQTLRQQQTPITDRLKQLESERANSARQLVALRDDNERLNRNTSELLTLRSKSNSMQAQARELAEMKSALVQQTGQTPDYLTNLMAKAGDVQKQRAEDRLGRMKKILHLTDAQAQAISNIMLNNIQRTSQMTLDLMTGKLTPDQRKAQLSEIRDEEAEIKALFSPEQLAAYAEFKHQEKSALADKMAKRNASKLAKDFKLSNEQEEKIRASFYDLHLSGFTTEEIDEINKNSSDLADITSRSIAIQKLQLENKLKILAPFLTPEQIAQYGRKELNQIETQAKTMKLLLPGQSTGADD